MFRLLALIACSIQFVGFHALGSCMSANPPGDYGIKEVKLSDVLYYAQGITRSGGLEEAEKIYERAIALHVWDNASELLVLYVSAAETALMRHDFSRADEYYQKTVRLLEENADLPNEYKIALAAMYIKFGADIDDYLSDPVKGEYYFNLGVALNPQASPRQQASYHYEKGVYSATQGKYVQALASYMKALELYERLQDPKGLINVYNSLSYLHCRKKEAAPARHYLEKTLNVLQEQGVDIALLPWVCDTAGAVYALDGAYAEAEKYFRLTLEGVTNDASYPPARIGRYYENLGDVLAKQNKEAEALVAWQTALEYFKKAGISDAEKEVVEMIFNLKR